MSSIAFDIGNFVIWSWLVLSPLFVMVVDAIHRIDRTLRHRHYSFNRGDGLRFWRGWWFDFAHNNSHYLVGFLWAAIVVSAGVVFGQNRNEWDLIPFFLTLIDQVAEPIGWLCLLALPFPVWLISIKLSVFLIVKWSKK
ncbi:MAG: hypothetical protein ACRCTP_02245 [Aeromonas popoffii]|uniref:hypothetical protein n=1 Tax=Aeromonas popoffii TaxID=70856 RepID=UPI003F2B4FAA